MAYKLATTDLSATHTRHREITRDKEETGKEKCRRTGEKGDEEATTCI